jgi:hypothetical protein
MSSICLSLNKELPPMSILNACSVLPALPFNPAIFSNIAWCLVIASSKSPFKSLALSGFLTIESD